MVKEHEFLYCPNQPVSKVVVSIALYLQSHPSAHSGCSQHGCSVCVILFWWTNWWCGPLPHFGGRDLAIIPRIGAGVGGGGGYPAGATWC